MRSSLLSCHKKPICESGKGRKTLISFVPEENGFHRLMVALDEEDESSHHGFLSAKVSVTVKKERQPYYVFVWRGFEWTL